jgi:hypothetical protein
LLSFFFPDRHVLSFFRFVTFLFFPTLNLALYFFWTISIMVDFFSPFSPPFFFWTILDDHGHVLLFFVAFSTFNFLFPLPEKSEP